MKTLGIIALLTLLPSTECAHPHYTFRCLENGEIDLFGIHNTSKIISLNGTGSCTKTDVNRDPTNQYYIIPKECANFKTVTGIRRVTIVINDPIYDGVMPSTNIPTTTPTGGRGTHRFEFVCKGIPDGGVNKTVVHVFQNKLNNVLPENNVDVDGVEMRFKAFRDVNSPDIDTIFVGDEFFMYIKYLGSMSYTIFNYEIGSKEINFYKYFLILICTMNLNLSKQNYHFIMVKLFFFIFPFILINQMLPKIFSMMETLGFSHFIQFCIVLRTFL